MTCPVCAKAYPAPAPCSQCWERLTPAQRAPWIAAFRRDPTAFRPVRHRDPVAGAPPTLRAYVEHLEAKEKQ